MPSLAPIDGGLRLHSDALGLVVRHDEHGRLRFRDPETGEDLLAHEEMRERVEQEIAARRAAEARLDETEARLDEEAAAHRAARAGLEETVAERDARIAELAARLRRTSGTG